MTLPDERYRAVMQAYQFLHDLAYDRKQYPRLSKEVRQRAHSLLRHYPSKYEMNVAAAAAPDVFMEKMEPLYRMVKQYDQEKENE